MAMTSCHNIDEQMSQKRDDQMSDAQLSQNHGQVGGGGGGGHVGVVGH